MDPGYTVGSGRRSGGGAMHSPLFPCALFAFACGACSSSGRGSPPADGGRHEAPPVLDGAAADATTSMDADADGLPDATEAALARDFFPYVSLDPADHCARHGVVYRVTPHPSSPGKIVIWFDLLYEHDCGLNGHPGDDEVFAVVADPAIPAPGGILAVRAISHQGTPCEIVTTCGSLPGCAPCTTAPRDGKDYPVVFPSIDKHGSYVSESTCDASTICDVGGCTLNAAPDRPGPSAMVNAGEPARPLVRDLTAGGFITPENGWAEPTLLDFDPWGDTNFGGAGNVTSDLQDPAFVVPGSGC